MHTTKYITLLALLGVASLNGKQNGLKYNVAQVRSLTN
jgi:hypothetical protein